MRLRPAVNHQIYGHRVSCLVQSLTAKSGKRWIARRKPSLCKQRDSDTDSYAHRNRDATPTPPEAKPFLIHDDSFLKILGEDPTVQVLIEDRRAPYFYNGGVYNSKTNSFFISSAPIPNSSPSAAPSKNLTVVLSKIEFYDRDHTRDKVRTGETSFMFGSGCNYGAGMVLCSHGTLKDPACLVFMELKRPHKMHILLTNYMGQMLNSPHSCVAHPDGSIWFSDPHITSYRPKPKLPPMIYRFNPQTSDLKAVTNDVKRPTCLAFSPSYKTLYVIDGAVYAFTVLQPYGFVTQKRLFAWLDAKAMVVDCSGNVFIAVDECIYIYAESGSLIGRINIEKCTGLCFGSDNQLLASAGEKLWQIQLNTKKTTAKT